jgi:NADPH-dependent 2,4-dienoyl-CoA reductase/sulfur reductase-like enzyme
MINGEIGLGRGERMRSTDLLIVGAGPFGLALAA